MHKKIESLLIKPAGPDCNLSCEYCFYRGKSGLFPESPSHRMSLKVLEQTIMLAMKESGPRIAFGWQGGEPTLMGKDFFREAVKLQIKYGSGKIVSNGLQTNGLLIDKGWADFLREFRFLVGLSLDGPEHIHDRYRTGSKDGGSWKYAVRGGRTLLERGVPVNALSVVNDYSENYPEEIYHYLKELGFRHMQFIPCFEVDPVKRNRADFSCTPKGYGGFLCKTFDLWLDDFADGAPTTFIRFIDSIFYNFVGMEAPDCSLNRTCGNYLVIEHNGNAYPCDFYVDADSKLGNVADKSLIEMLNSAKQEEFGARKQHWLEDCLICPWYPYCGGGCQREWVSHGDGRRQNYFCESFVMFFEHAGEVLREMADKWLAARQGTDGKT